LFHNGEEEVAVGDQAVEAVVAIQAVVHTTTTMVIIEVATIAILPHVFSDVMVMLLAYKIVETVKYQGRQPVSL
jgi:hypothetical protein